MSRYGDKNVKKNVEMILGENALCSYEIYWGENRDNQPYSRANTYCFNAVKFACTVLRGKTCKVFASGDYVTTRKSKMQGTWSHGIVQKDTARWGTSWLCGALCVFSGRELEITT